MPHPLRAGIVLLAVVAAGNAAADAVAEMELATRQLKEAQHEQAIVVLSRAVDRDDLTAEQRSGLYLLLGIARHELRDVEGARMAFRKALEANENAPLPHIASPKTRALFEEVRQRFAADRIQFAPAPAVPPPVQAPPAASTGGAQTISPAVLSEAQTPAAGTSRPVEHTSRARLIGALSVAAVGTAIGGPGIFLLVDARTRRNQAAMNPDAMSAANLYSDAYDENILGICMAAAGGAAIAVAATIALWPRSPPPPVAVGAGPRGVVLSAQFP